MASASIENLLEGLSSEDLDELSADIAPSIVSCTCVINSVFLFFALHSLSTKVFNSRKLSSLESAQCSVNT